MNVAVIGSGGREHAICLAISKSKLLDKLYVLPGNPGIAQLGTNVDIEINDHKLICYFCKEKNIQLVVVGPEKPLIDGLSDNLREQGINVFGPSKKAARIEGEKSFAKNLMKVNNIPTASYEIFDKLDYDKAITYLSKINYPIVIKADGIAAGKGVVVAHNFDDAKQAVDNCFVYSEFGSAGEKIVIEEFMTGQEASIFVITDGKDFILLPAAQDHKRIWDGDKGKNTGGMGSYAPTPFVDDQILNSVISKIVLPTLTSLSRIDSPFSGCLYCGLMLTSSGPKVVEFNCRFGDPETQVVLPLLDGDFLKLLFSVATGKIDKNSISFNGGASVCVVLASKGYPDKYEKGKEILGLNNINDNEIIIYHSGTMEVEGKYFSNGGRVLGVTSIVKENNLSRAKQIVYQAISKIHFDGMQYRKDISDKALLN